MDDFPSDKVLVEIHNYAVSIAEDAGQILSSYFGQSVNVSYKDVDRTDPVTEADIESQRFVSDSISKRFADHYILSEEEDEHNTQDEINNDFIWVVDPLDGTRNFIAGIPIFACSIGVLYKGIPVVGAIYIPWIDGLGKVVHARFGAGAFLGDKQVSISSNGNTDNVNLSAVPADFFSRYRLSLSRKVAKADPRVTGSIAYELAMTATGTMKYAFINGPYLWDIAGGALIVQEAGGLVMKCRIQRNISSLFLPRCSWEPIYRLTDSGKEFNVRMMRSRWKTPLMFGDPVSIGAVTKNLRKKKII